MITGIEFNLLHTIITISALILGIFDLFLKRVPKELVSLTWFCCSFVILANMIVKWNCLHVFVIWFVVTGWIITHLLDVEKNQDNKFYYCLPIPLSDALCISILPMCVAISWSGFLNLFLSYLVYFVIYYIAEWHIEKILQDKKKVLDFLPVILRIPARFFYAMIEMRPKGGHPIRTLFAILWFVCYVFNPFGALYLQFSLYIEPKSLLSFLTQ